MFRPKWSFGRSAKIHTASLYYRQTTALCQDQKSAMAVSFNLIPDNAMLSSQTIRFQPVSGSDAGSQVLRASFPVADLRDEGVTLRPVLNNLAAEKCQGVLVHVFVGGESALPKIGTQPTDLTMPVPTRYQLEQNYPNPFNASTVICYALPAPGQVRMAIYNLRGERVRTLVAGERIAGVYQVNWDGCNNQNEPVASGIYICRFAGAGKIHFPFMEHKKL